MTDDTSYYTGGLAELEPTPSEFTAAYFFSWFTGAQSIGKAMQLLHLPYVSNKKSIVELRAGEMFVNLKVEEQTLYAHTIFSYQKQQTIQNSPQLKVDVTKLFNPLYLYNTTRILIAQAQWIAHPQKYIELAQMLIENLPDNLTSLSAKEVDVILRDNVWPVVIMIGQLSEFYFQLSVKEAGRNETEVTTLISTQVARNDWFFKSYADQLLVQEGRITLDSYMQQYGCRADQDYELTCPRWQEIPTQIKLRIRNAKKYMQKSPIQRDLQKPLATYIETTIAMQILRSEAKKKALISFNQLRRALMDEKKLPVKKDELNTKSVRTTQQTIIRKGNGVGVAQGNIAGKALIIKNTSQTIAPGTIGIFPNASPHYAMQFPKCDGLIFLKGGQTSHGAIVAREFAIPAIIAGDATDIPNKATVQLNGKKGTWEIV